MAYTWPEGVTVITGTLLHNHGEGEPYHGLLTKEITREMLTPLLEKASANPDNPLLAGLSDYGAREAIGFLATASFMRSCRKPLCEQLGLPTDVDGGLEAHVVPSPDGGDDIEPRLLADGVTFLTPSVELGLFIGGLTGSYLGPATAPMQVRIRFVEESETASLDEELTALFREKEEKEENEEG